MIDLHHWPAPNGINVSVFLEEAGTPYMPSPAQATDNTKLPPQAQEPIRRILYPQRGIPVADHLAGC